jgi:peptidoglycan/xylan/chitin deacetylase (PgdA/CDA1 family)
VTGQIGPDGLTAGRIRRMLEAGWELDSHTVTHPDLSALDDRALRRELVVRLARDAAPAG